MSPFMTPDQSRRRRELARQRRKRRRTIGLGAFALAVVVAVAVAVALSHSGGRTSASTSTAAKTTQRVKTVAAPTLSAIGLPLAKPALTLSGIGLPGRDSVHIAFHHPPRAGVLFNLTSGQVLWQHNPFVHLRIASLTKMMTALLTVRSAPPGGRVLVTKAAVASAGSKVGVLPLGKHVRVETMLYGLLLPSGNDAAIALAQRAAGTVPRFVALMNAKARALGLTCTHFTTPSGFQDRDNHSCAADLAAVARALLRIPRLARIVRTRQAVRRFPIKGHKLYLYNNNPLLESGYRGTTGVKTGYTVAAGICLVGAARRGPVHLGVVLLHSPDTRDQARRLLDKGFAAER
jgi:D-alanyl-D-alanine carboxypeptidase